jgi:hypothetical protein
VVMSHAEAELYIHPPILDASVADQRIANALWWNGLHMELPLPGEVEEGLEESMMNDVRPNRWPPPDTTPDRCRASTFALYGG